MVDFLRMQYFIAVAEYLNFTKAASSLCITQPSLSHQISLLEEEVGAALLLRTKRSVTLTPAGRYFLSEARSLVSQRDAMLRSIHCGISNEAGILRLGYWEIVDYGMLSRLLRLLHAHYPNIQVDLQRENLSSLMQDLHMRKLDILYTANVKINGIPWADSKMLGRSKYQLIVADDHPLADKKLVEGQDI